MNPPRVGDTVNLSREVDALRVPSGEPVRLLADEPARITQLRGNNATVIVRGNLFRIAGRDADALGVAIDSNTPRETGDGTIDEDQLWQAMRQCYDPEIPVNIVDLGLVYDCAAEKLPEGGYSVAIRMTLTAPGCGMGTAIAADVEERVREVPGVRDAHVQLVWDPPWNQEMMSEAAKLELGLL